MLDTEYTAETFRTLVTWTIINCNFTNCLCQSYIDVIIEKKTEKTNCFETPTVFPILVIKKELGILQLSKLATHNYLQSKRTNEQTTKNLT